MSQDRDMTNWRFAPLDLDEAASLRALHGLLQAVQAGDVDAGADPREAEALARGVLDGEQWIGCWMGDDLIGAVGSQPDADDDLVTAIAWLGVRPEWCRQGLATLLLHALRTALGSRAALSATLLEEQAALRACLQQAAGLKEWRRWAERRAGVRLSWVKLGDLSLG